MNATEAVAVLRDAIEKHCDPEWECNSDHPALLAALDATAAIAPPVAAGSVDTSGMQRYTPDMVGEMVEHVEGDYVLHADVIAWGVQQREAGRNEVAERKFIWTSSNPPGTCLQCNDRECVYGSGYCASCVYRFTTNEDVHDLRQRAEKAEALHKEADEIASELLEDANEVCLDLMKAEARVKELEAQIATDDRVLRITE